MTITNSSRCYDTAFKLVTGKDYYTLPGTKDNNGIEAVEAEVNRVGDLMFEG